ncbi:MAG: redoxin domain-containing protein [Bacteroidales bacterium]|nr:redoxin domain-containing protein [Bacteroidales bacterium]MBN2750332.1 redoxin domain-containing protein [Bacteroidales bacterium]
MQTQPKQKRKFLIAIAAILVLISLAYVLTKSHDNNDKYATTFPNLSLKSLNGNAITSLPILNNTQTIIMLYQSECSSCYGTFDQIVNNLYDIPRVQVLMVSPDSLESIRNFKNRFDLDPDMPISFYQCNKMEAKKLFGNFLYPTILLYSSEQQLLLKMDEIIDVDELFAKIAPNL